MLASEVESNPPEPPEPSPSPGSILLVDDHAGNRLAMEDVLGKLGHPVIAVASGGEALACLEHTAVVLIVLDVQMPGLDGFQTLVKIRARREWTEIPVVFMTAIYGDAQSEAHGYTLGAVDYVSKPFNVDVVTAKLRSHIAMHERSHALRREAEELARERATRAERERILGVVSHDLRSPLTTIRTGADVLLASERLGERELTVARRIQRNADRMARLINDLLDFSRLQHAPLRTRPAAADLAELVSETVEDIGGSDRRKIELSLETRRHGSFDADRVTQVLGNLIRNAVQHSPATARVAVTLRERGPNFELTVWNEGEMKVGDRDALFEAFQRGDDSKGMGLGLYISQQIARSHGGEITVSSTREDGTSFHFILPIRAPSPSAG